MLSPQSRRPLAKNHHARRRGFKPFLFELDERCLLSMYIVNDPGDAPLGGGPPGETCDGTITLRSAIQQVDSDGGGSIGFAGAMTIEPYDLPAITAPGVTINGGNLGSVVIDGGGAVDDYVWPALVLDGGGSLIENLEITGFISETGNNGGYTANAVIYINYNYNILSHNIIFNNYCGVETNGDSGNTIGGTTAGAGNIVSANGDIGVVLDGASGTLVAGNFIGIDATGDIPMGNGGGIEIVDGASKNTIGGTTQTARNMISASTSDDGDGVLISDDDTTGNLVQGNYIGTGDDGSSTLGNQEDGISILDASGNTIGGTSSGAGNLISANRGDGVDLDGATGNLVAGNDIGTNRGGTVDLGNSQAGIWIQNDSYSNTIGGTTKGAGNTIAFNGGNGITVGEDPTDTAVENAILGNSIYSNAAIGIDLGNDGATPNGADGHNGPNLFQDYPVLTSAITGKNSTTIAGTLSAADDTNFRIEFFSNPAGTSQGKTYLGFVDVTTNGSGSASFSFAPASVVGAGLNITATATDPHGDTSEFSAPATVLSNVTSDVSVKAGGFVYNRTTRQFTQTLTITNISDAALTGPIELVLLNLENATLVNQSGTYQVSPYITILNSGSLGVGQSLTITLVFADPTLATITYTPEFLMGPMPPQN
ncbi:MAG: beta strand repeat-containing protein [Isosphaeraceae bacterium]